MTTLRIGIRTYQEAREQMLAIARGEAKADPNAPQVWVTSLASLAQILNDENRALLRLIGERNPVSLTNLAALSGRSVPSLSRTLATLESYGLVEMVEHGRAKAPRLAATRIEIVLSDLGPETVMAAE